MNFNYHCLENFYLLVCFNSLQFVYLTIQLNFDNYCSCNCIRGIDLLPPLLAESTLGWTNI